MVVVRASESRLGSKARQWSAVGEAVQSLGGNVRSLGGNVRSLGSDGHSFEFSTASIPINGPQSGGNAPSTLPLPASSMPAALSPGEKRTSKEYREHSFSDILTPLAYAGISAATVSA